MTSSPAGAFMIEPTRSPQRDTSASHFSQATTPFTAQSSAYSDRRCRVRAGMAPSELLMRYVHVERIGNSARHAKSELVSTSMSPNLARFGGITLDKHTRLYVR